MKAWLEWSEKRHHGPSWLLHLRAPKTLYLFCFTAFATRQSCQRRQQCTLVTKETVVANCGSVLFLMLQVFHNRPRSGWCHLVWSWHQFTAAVKGSFWKLPSGWSPWSQSTMMLYQTQLNKHSSCQDYHFNVHHPGNLFKIIQRTLCDI